MVAELVNPLDRGLEPTRRPFRAEERAKRRRIEYITKRFARARTPRQKFDVAVDYLTATTTDHRIDQAEAAVALEQLARLLIDRADQLTQTLRRNR